MPNYHLQLFSHIMQQLYGKNILIYNRSGEINEVNKAKYVTSLRDYGDAVFYDDNFYAHLFYWFAPQELDMEAAANFLLSPIKQDMIGSKELKEFIERINKDYFTMYLSGENKDLHYLSGKILFYLKCYHSEEQIKQIRYFLSRAKLASNPLGTIVHYKSSTIKPKGRVYYLNPPHSSKETVSLAKKRLKNISPDDAAYEMRLEEEETKIDPGFYQGGHHYLGKFYYYYNIPYLPKIVRDFYKVVYKDSILFIERAYIDNEFISELIKHFQNQMIRFEECTIAKNSNFSLLGSRTIVFANMDIDLKRLHYTSNDYTFIGCNVTGSAHFLSTSLSFLNCIIDYQNLFLTSEAPNLQTLEIDNLDKKDKHNNYQYLPYFSPNIHTLSISSELTSTHFMTRLRNLSSVDIRSEATANDMGFLLLNNEHELQRIRILNAEKIKQEILRYGIRPISDFELSLAEIQRIKELCGFYNRLTYDIKDLKKYQSMYDKYSSFADFVKSPEYMRLDQGYYLANNKEVRLITWGEISELNGVVGYNKVFDVCHGYLVIRDQFLYDKSLYETSGKLLLNHDGRPFVFLPKMPTVPQKYRLQPKIPVESIKEINYSGTAEGFEWFTDYALKELFNEELYFKDDNNNYEEIEIDSFTYRLYEHVGIDIFNYPEATDKFFKKLEEKYPNMLPLFTHTINRYLNDDRSEKKEQAMWKLIVLYNETLFKLRDKISIEELAFLYGLNFYGNYHFIESFRIMNRAWQKYGVNIDFSKYSVEEISKKCAFDFKNLTEQLGKLYEQKSYQGMGIMLTREAIEEIMSAPKRVKQMIITTHNTDNN